MGPGELGALGERALELLARTLPVPAAIPDAHRADEVRARRGGQRERALGSGDRGLVGIAVPRPEGPTEMHFAEPLVCLGEIRFERKGVAEIALGRVEALQTAILEEVARLEERLVGLRRDFLPSSRHGDHRGQENCDGGHGRRERADESGPRAFLARVRQKAISAPGQRLDESWGARVVAKSGPDLLDAGVQAPFEMNVGLLAPELAAQLLAGHDFARPAREDGEDPNRLRGKLQGLPVPVELQSGQVQLETIECDPLGHRSFILSCGKSGKNQGRRFAPRVVWPRRYEDMSSILLALALLSSPQTDPLEEAVRLFAAEDWEGASAAYRKLVADSPDDGRAWLRLGIALQRLDRHEEAVAALRRADALGFLPPITRFEIARSSALLGNAESALDFLEGAVEAGYAQPDQLADTTAFASLSESARFQAAVARARVNAEPCEHIPEFRQFDFWLGDWNVTARGSQAGTNRIEKLEGGCLLQENWSSSLGGTGTSMNYYDAVKKKWVQVWVDSSGTSIHAEAELRDGAMRFEGEHHYPDGRVELYKMTFTPNEDGSVRQFIEQSNDGGESWYVWFDGLYEKN